MVQPTYDEGLNAVARTSTKIYNSRNLLEIHDDLNVERAHGILRKVNIMANART